MIEYDWDQRWTRAIPDQQAILDFAKRISHFRAGVARDFLVYGRMLRPWVVSGIRQRDSGAGLEPLVYSATWRAPDGRIGVVLANYSDQIEYPRIELMDESAADSGSLSMGAIKAAPRSAEGDQDPGSHEKKTVSVYLDDQKQDQIVEMPGVVGIAMQPRSLALVELK